MISLMMAMAMFAAEPAAAPAAAPAAKKVQDPNEMVCKREKASGSNMKVRVCMTAAQWEDRRAQDKEMLDGAQRAQPLKTD